MPLNNKQTNRFSCATHSISSNGLVRFYSIVGYIMPYKVYKYILHTVYMIGKRKLNSSKYGYVS